MTPAQYHQQALALEQAGRRTDAMALLKRGLAEHKEQPDLLTTAANMALRTNDLAAAVALFRRAVAVGEGRIDYVLNLAIALTRAGQAKEAVKTLREHEAAGTGQARYWTARASAEREADALTDAARSYDRALAVEPTAKALHGRARVALERGEDAVDRFKAALAQEPGNPELWLGLAQAHEALGEREPARRIASHLIDQAPAYLDALNFAVGLDPEGATTGETVFEKAAKRQPADPNIRAAWINALVGRDRFADAAKVAARASTDFPHIAALALWHATNLSASGDLAAATAAFAAVDLHTVEALLQRVRHALRLHDPEQAERLIQEILAQEPGNIAAWALRSVAWRLTGDGRIDWLHGQDGLTRLTPLVMEQADLDTLRRALHDLHDRAAFPLGQSLRGGTQTRGRLFAHHDPIFQRLHWAVEAMVEGYRTALPPADPDHPLLRHRDTGWKLAGSWSVRLSAGADHHTAHIHPQGLASSALYIALPEGMDGEGDLELGRPPADLRLDLGPEKVIVPREGHAALFPSTLYHGTTPFTRGQRLTVAFDVVPA